MLTDTRKQVMAQIIATMEEAQAKGLNPMTVARHAYRGVPDGVLHEALAELSLLEEEAWWSSIEKTIDGEVIRNAIARVSAR